MKDETLALLRNPYGFVPERARALGRDAFATRLFLRRSVCLTGPEAAELFYDAEHFSRVGAAPLPVQLTLFGRHGLQGLDGAAHRERKHLLRGLMGPSYSDDLAGRVAHAWYEAARGWAGRDRIALYPELQRVLARAACDWVGVPLPDEDVARRTRQIVSQFNDPAAPGPRFARAFTLRRAANHWVRGLVDDVRSGRLDPAEGTALAQIARHRASGGHLLPRKDAGVELLNVIRPTVAISVYLTLVAQALRDHPEWRQRLRDEPELTVPFVEEVRRFYPFFPTVVARARHALSHDGVAIEEGKRTVLDLYGTNRDARAWADPESFRPERFVDAEPGPYEFVPQGGGDPAVTHRCPGELVTTKVMAVGVDFLVRQLDFTWAEPGERLRTDRAPALPEHGLLLRDVRLRA